MYLVSIFEEKNQFGPFIFIYLNLVSIMVNLIQWSPLR